MAFSVHAELPELAGRIAAVLLVVQREHAHSVYALVQRARVVVVALIEHLEVIPRFVALRLTVLVAEDRVGRAQARVDLIRAVQVRGQRVFRPDPVSRFASLVPVTIRSGTALAVARCQLPVSAAPKGIFKPAEVV